MCAIFFFFQAEDGIRDIGVTGVQTCALPIYGAPSRAGPDAGGRAITVEWSPGPRPYPSVPDLHPPWPGRLPSCTPGRGRRAPRGRPFQHVTRRAARSPPVDSSVVDLGPRLAVALVA